MKTAPHIVSTRWNYGIHGRSRATVALDVNSLPMRWIVDTTRITYLPGDSDTAVARTMTKFSADCRLLGTCRRTIRLSPDLSDNRTCSVPELYMDGERANRACGSGSPIRGPVRPALRPSPRRPAVSLAESGPPSSQGKFRENAPHLGGITKRQKSYKESLAEPLAYM